MEFTGLTKRIKLEENESPENFRENAAFDEKTIKLESVDDEEDSKKKPSEAFEKEIKLNPMIENVKEELLDDDYFVMNIPKLEPYEGAERTETATSSNHLENAYLDPLNSEFEMSEVLNKAETSRSRRRSCVLCQKPEHSKNIKHIFAESTKLILISVFYKKYFMTAARATELLNATSCPVCASHYPDVVSQLQECFTQPQKMNDLMSIVNVIRPNMTIREFRFFTDKFVQKNSKIVDNIKMQRYIKEPLNDEYYELNIPKLESYDETETAEIATTSNCYEKTSTVDEHESSAIREYWCSLCRKLQNSKALKNTPSESARLIFISVFFKDYFVTVTQAMEFLNAVSCRICIYHYTDVATQLQKFLRQPQKMNDLMNTVNVFRPIVTIKQFRTSLKHFISRSVYNKRTSRETMNTVCAICEQTPRTIIIMRLKPVKLVLMVGCVLSGTHRIEEAKLFISTDSVSYPICHSHLTTSIDEICKSVRIEKYVNISGCRVDDMQKLMGLVNVLCPEMQCVQFHNLVMDLSSKTDKFRETTDAK